MSSRKKAMTQPINQIFRLLQRKERVLVWLYENTGTLRMEGVIIGFDEYMNLVLDDAVEINRKTHTTQHLGRILLKGDNITLIMHAYTAQAHTLAFSSPSSPATFSSVPSVLHVLASDSPPAAASTAR